MELEHLPVWVGGDGVDLSAGMLERAHWRRAELDMHNLDLRMMDTRTLAFPDEGFEAVYLPLILTVVEDAGAHPQLARPQDREGEHELRQVSPPTPSDHTNNSQPCGTPSERRWVGTCSMFTEIPVHAHAGLHSTQAENPVCSLPVTNRPSCY
jgi:hypothetical protein